MEPVPETAEALQELALEGDEALRAELDRMAQRVREIVPECIGLSLGVVSEGLTFTLVASGHELAALDAVQYLDGGPCVAATAKDRDARQVSIPDLLDEQRWHLFARATAAAGVQSSLSLPIVSEDHVLAGVNLYASTPDAFAGHQQEIAAALGAWAPGVVQNADLSFSTRLEAARAPERLRSNREVDVAVGVIAELQHVSTSVATTRLAEAAARAGISEAQAAQAIVGILSA